MYLADLVSSRRLFGLRLCVCVCCCGCVCAVLPVCLCVCAVVWVRPCCLCVCVCVCVCLCRGAFLLWCVCVCAVVFVCPCSLLVLFPAVGWILSTFLSVINVSGVPLATRIPSLRIAVVGRPLGPGPCSSLCVDHGVPFGVRDWHYFEFACAASVPADYT